MFLKPGSLLSLIGRDCCRQGISLFGLLMIALSAVGLVWMTHQIRSLTHQQAALLTEQCALDSEWRNLILEIQSLSDADRIERLAKEKLKMQLLNSQQERVVKQV